MPVKTKPVEDSVPKVNNEVAVGEDLAFQQRWWKFERIIWPIFCCIIALDLAGAFGRGPLAKASAKTADSIIELKYERIERYGTPSLINVSFGPQAIHNSEIHLWVSESLVKDLGNQRIVPQPKSSVVGAGGILYTFPATTIPVSLAFALEPASPGLHHLRLQIPETGSNLNLNIFVVP